jgi:hypothetical protein
MISIRFFCPRELDAPPSAELVGRGGAAGGAVALTPGS